MHTTSANSSFVAYLHIPNLPRHFGKQWAAPFEKIGRLDFVVSREGADRDLPILLVH